MDLHLIETLLRRALESGITPVGRPFLTFDAEKKSMIAHSVTTSKEIEQNLLGILNEATEMSVYDKTMLNAGLANMAVSRQMVMQWLLLHASRVGARQAAADLVNHLNLDHNPALEVLAVSGVEIAGTYEIYPGCLLVPFNDLRDSSPKRDMDPDWLKPEILSQHGIFPLTHASRVFSPPQAALTRKTEIKPKFISPENDGFTPDHTSTLLTDICDSLVLVGKCSPLGLARWYEIDNTVPASELIGSAWTSPHHDVLNHDSVKVTEEMLASATTIVRGYLNLPEPMRRRLRVPLNRLGKARRHRSYVDKAIDLGVALESLYLGDREEKSEVAFTFRLRASWHLGKDAVDRKRLLVLFNRIYEMRSKAVHRGEMLQQVNLGDEGKISVDKLIGYADDLCVEGLMKVISAGEFPNWEDLILDIH